MKRKKEFKELFGNLANFQIFSQCTFKQKLKNKILMYTMENSFDLHMVQQLVTLAHKHLFEKNISIFDRMYMPFAKVSTNSCEMN